jgi:hypothetical protein
MVPEIRIVDAYFESVSRENNDLFEDLFQFKEQLCALLLNKPSMAKSISQLDLKHVSSFPKSSSEADLSSYGSSQLDDLGTGSEKEAVPPTGMKALFYNVRDKFTRPNKDVMATNLITRTTEKVAMSRVNNLQNYYDKLMQGLHKKIDGTYSCFYDIDIDHRGYE